MYVVTIESLLHNLCEYYLPINISKNLINSRNKTKERYKNIIKHLAGQKKEYTVFVENRKDREVKVNHVNINNFFSGQIWQNIVNLIKIRDSIVHITVKSEMTKGNNHISKKIQNSKDIEIKNPEELLKNVEKFFNELKSIFNKSIDDYVDDCLEKMFFNFY